MIFYDRKTLSKNEGLIEIKDSKFK